MRSIGMGSGPIPFDRMVWYIETFLEPDSPDEMDRYILLMRRMDSAYQTATAPKKESKGAGTK